MQLVSTATLNDVRSVTCSLLWSDVCAHSWPLGAWFIEIAFQKVCVRVRAYVCMYICMFVCTYVYLFAFPHPKEQSFISQKQPVYEK